MSEQKYSHEFTGYPENYTGPMTGITDKVRTDLGTLMRVLVPAYDGSPIPEEHLRSYIESPTQRQFVAIRGGRIVGTMSASVGAELYAGKFLFTGSLAVLPEWRGMIEAEGGRSIYSQMLEHVDAFAREHGAKKLFCAISPKNEASKRSHEKAGYETKAGFWEREVPSVE